MQNGLLVRPNRVFAVVLRRIVAPGVSLLLAAGSTLAGEFSASFATGYTGGLGFRGSVMAKDFARGFPLGLEFGIGYTIREPGNAADARRIFINDNTNGTPEKAGHMWDFRLDFLYPLRSLPASLYAGVRRSYFNANFDFVGGNENFDVTSDQWGIGAGLKGLFEMSPKLSLVVSAGMEYFFSAQISGHDTAYSPDGEHINPRDNYTYDDADAAINQPKFFPAALIGVSYSF